MQALTLRISKGGRPPFDESGYALDRKLPLTLHHFSLSKFEKRRQL